MTHTHQEISDAFDHFVVASAEGGITGDWSAFANCFIPDVHYVEHNLGVMNGREAVREFLNGTMAEWPFNHMQLFPWDWYTIDAEQGFVIGQVQNRMVDPGDGETYQVPNWTRLVYAGDGLFAEEEDVYDPATFEPMLTAWLAAYAAAHPDQPTGAPRP